LAADAHPTYPNPTIVEALVEVHVELPHGRDWAPVLAGELFKALQPDFPTMEPVLESTFELQLDTSGIRHTLHPPRQRMRYRHGSRPVLVQLAERIFTVNVLSPYPGWQEVKRIALESWSKAQAVLGAERITRVGLRYINRIPSRDGRERPGDYLEATPYIPGAVLESESEFFSRVVASRTPAERWIVTLAADAMDDRGKGIIFDIDRITQQTTPPRPDALASVIERLHQDVWEVFVAAKGPGLERLLLGGEP